MAKPRLALTDSEVRRLYLEERMSIHEIANTFGVHRDVIRLRLDDLGVERRDRQEAHDLARLVRASADPICAQSPCTMQPSGLGAHPELCYFHAKRASGLLDAGPRKDHAPATGSARRRARR